MQLVYAIIAVVVATVVASVVTNKVTISKLKNDAKSKLGNAEAKAREIIDADVAAKVIRNTITDWNKSNVPVDSKITTEIKSEINATARATPTFTAT